MIELLLKSGEETFTISPHKINIPVPGLNQNLQHQEETVNCSVVCEPELMGFFMQNPVIDAVIKDGETSVFTGIVDTGFEWNDVGAPNPIDFVTFNIRDNTRLLDRPIGQQFARKEETLGNIIAGLCTIAGVEIAEDSLTPIETIPVFALSEDKNILQTLNSLLFQYTYAFGFDGNGKLFIFSLDPEAPETFLTEDDILATFKGKKSKKDYDRIKIGYGQIVIKRNEQVYFEGNDLGEDMKVVPITLRPGQYYPYDSDPIQEAREGQIYQQFEDGFAESYTKYCGEKAYRRSQKTNLIYTENQRVTQDWSGSVQVDRTDFEALRASVRLHNTGTEDAQVYQLAIRADAWYRSEASFIRGTGTKDYTYDAEFIYSEDAASKLSSILSRFFLGGNYTFTVETNCKLIPGTTVDLNTGVSSISANCFVLSTNFDTNKKTYSSTLMTYGDVVIDTHKYKEQTTIPDVEQQVITTVEKKERVEVPGNISDLLVIAEEKGLRLSYSIGSSKKFKNLVAEIKKGDGEYKPVKIDGDFYYFDRTEDGYPEREELLEWKLRVKAENIYGGLSQEWTEAGLNCDNYGTWIVNAPKVVVRQSDRTITLMFSQPANATGQRLYGVVRYGVQVQRPDIDTEFYTPNESANPEEAETNYKVTDGHSYVYRDEVYVQTMPLKGQQTHNIVDTLYRFKVVTKNEVGISSATEVNATALCTGIKDLVKANQTAKEQYVEKLSAISANLGEVSGSLAGNAYNYWTLADMLGSAHKQGAFRVGDASQGLLIIPPHDVAEGYENNTNQVQVILRAGIFELTSTNSKINGELIVQEDATSLDRTRITPTGTFFEHRENEVKPWVVIASNTSNGIKSQQMYSDRTLSLSNQNMTTRRLEGTDIGNPYLSDSSRVIHFDENLLDQLGGDYLTIVGTHELKDGSDSGSNIDFTPAILTVSPYSTVGRSIYGQFSAAFALAECIKFTVDFWIQYIFAENQVIFEIGNLGDRIRLIIQAAEPFWNDINTPYSTPDDNFYITKEQGQTELFTKLELDPFIWNVPAEGEPPLTVPLEGEPLLITRAPKEWKPEYEFYVKENGAYKKRTIPVIDFDHAIEQGLYEQDCVMNNPDGEKTYIEHSGQAETENVYLSQLHVEFKENSWLHVGIVADETTLSVYLNDKKTSFNRFTTSAGQILVVLNGGRQSFLLDELFFDNTVAEPFETFVEHTENRIPWGKLTKDNDYFMLLAKDKTKVVTNLFETDVFKEALNQAFQSESFVQRIKEITNNQTGENNGEIRPNA